MKHLIFVSLILFLTLNLSTDALAQKTEKIDSLRIELSKAKSDTTRIRLFLELSMAFSGYQPDSSMYYASESLVKSIGEKFTKGRADALLQIGRLKRDLDATAEALDTMFVALKLYREINDQVQIANSLNDISIIYANSSDFKKSLEYFKQALEIFRQMGDEKGESYALNNIGIIYQHLQDDEMARQYFMESLKIKELNNDLYGISRGYTNLGSIAENRKQWDEALAFYFKADSIYAKTNDALAQSSNYVAIARVKERQNKVAEARTYATMGLDKAKETKSLSTMLSASELLANLEEKAGRYKSSLGYQKLYNTIADSLNSETHRAKLEELKAKFNLDEKEKEIAILKKDKQLQEAIMERKNITAYSLLGGILFMAIVSGLIFYAYSTVESKRRSLAFKNKEIEQQKNDLDKMNKEKDRFFSILSHDLRAPLSSLKGLSHLITSHGHSLTPEEATIVRNKIDNSLDNLTELVNNILEWSMTSSQNRKWTFDKIDTSALIQKNITLYKNIAESKSVHLVYHPKNDAYGYADYQAINTVVRNILSNSIKYSHENNHVTIAVMKTEKEIQISVKDQGIGMSAEVQENLFTLNGKSNQPGTNNEKGAGIGLMLCKELMKENNGDIQVKSKPGEGSEFIVSFPQHA